MKPANSSQPVEQTIRSLRRLTILLLLVSLALLVYWQQVLEVIDAIFGTEFACG